MSGIGNTIDTDLVGELAEIWQRDMTQPRIVAGGRIRAATADGGSIFVWLELITQDNVYDANHYLGRACHQLGDIICIGLASTDWSPYSNYLRLIKT